MEILIHAHDYVLSPRAEKYLREKFTKFTGLLHGSQPAQTIEVYVKKIGQQEVGDILHLSARVNLRQRRLFTEESGLDIFVLIDAVQQEMLRQLRREKEKPLARVKHGAAQVKEWLRFGRHDK